VPDFATRLDRCLDALKDGRSLHRVLQQSPAERDELIDLLRVSTDVAQLQLPAPDPAFKLRTRNLMLAVAAQRRASAARSRGFARPVFRLAGALALAGALLGAGIVAVAAQSLPGDPLYQVKRGVEQVQLTLTVDPAANARLRMQLATRRVSEAGRLSAQGRVAEALTLITAYNTDVAELGRRVVAAPLPPADSDRLERDVTLGQAEADGGLEAVAADLAARGHGEAAASVQHTEHQADQTLSGTKKALHDHGGKGSSSRPSPSSDN
jgi:hypothetical protein